MGVYNLAVIKGDGIGPEIVGEALKVLDRIGNKFGHEFNCTEVLAGGCAIDSEGECLPEKTVEVCKKSDAVILGAVGGPKSVSYTHLEGLAFITAVLPLGFLQLLLFR